MHTISHQAHQQHVHQGELQHIDVRNVDIHIQTQHQH